MFKHHSWETKLVAFAGLVRGLTAHEVSQQVGAGVKNVTIWAKLAGMTFKTGAHGGGVVGTPITDENESTDEHKTGTDQKEASYHRLTLANRSFIQAARSMSPPLSMRKIAAELGVAPSTISRELARSMVQDGRRGQKYSADVAHFRALNNRARPRPSKLSHPPLRAEVVARLDDKHSPQQVAAGLRRDYPLQKEMQVSHETIYQALYVQGKGALRHELTVEKALRSGRTTRVPRSKLPPRSSRPWLAGARLSDRPAEVEDRAVPGHWEGDLVVGPNRSGLVTLVERHTRYALVGRLPGCRESATVIDRLQEMIAGLPASLLRTVTWDQGSEMAEHARFTVATGCAVFFCDPHSPWQRGSNENLNGLIRDFYPKGTDFNLVSDEDIATMQRLLNDRPRQTLGWQTPREKLEEVLAVLR